MPKTLLERALIRCSGASREILNRCPESDKTRHVGSGGLILLTSIIATFSGGYAFYTIFKSIPISIFSGVVWGAFIFNLDRYMLTSMRKSSSKQEDYTQAIPRVFLGVLIALCISRPVELLMFNQEITEQLQKDKIGLLKQDIIDSDKIIGVYKSELQQSERKFKDEQELMKCEEAGKEICKAVRDGKVIVLSTNVGGRGIGPAYKEHLRNKIKFIKEYNELKPDIDRKIKEEEIRKSCYIEFIKRLEKNDIKFLATIYPTSLLKQNSALLRLSLNEPIVLVITTVVTLLFVSFEITPIGFKLLIKKGQYDIYIEEEDSALKVKEILAKYYETLCNVAVKTLISISNEIDTEQEDIVKFKGELLHLVKDIFSNHAKTCAANSVDVGTSSEVNTDTLVGEETIGQKFRKLIAMICPWTVSVFIGSALATIAPVFLQSYCEIKEDMVYTLCIASGSACVAFTTMAINLIQTIATVKSTTFIRG